MGELNSKRRELFCRLMADGFYTHKEACYLAGYGVKNGLRKTPDDRFFANVGGELMRKPDILNRIKELQRGMFDDRSGLLMEAINYMKSALQFDVMSRFDLVQSKNKDGSYNLTYKLKGSCDDWTAAERALIQPPTKNCREFHMASKEQVAAAIFNNYSNIVGSQHQEEYTSDEETERDNYFEGAGLTVGGFNSFVDLSEEEKELEAQVDNELSKSDSEHKAELTNTTVLKTFLSPVEYDFLQNIKEKDFKGIQEVSYEQWRKDLQLNAFNSGLSQEDSIAKYAILEEYVDRVHLRMLNSYIYAGSKS